MAANKPEGWEPCTTKAQPAVDEDGAFDMRPGANDKAQYYNCFEQQLDEFSDHLHGGIRSPSLAPTNEEIREGLANWDEMLRQLTINLRPILASKGLKLLGIDRCNGFDSRAAIQDSAGRRFDVDLSVDEVEARSNGRETFQVLEEMVVNTALAQREAFAERVKRLGRETSNVIQFGGGPRPK